MNLKTNKNFKYGFIVQQPQELYFTFNSYNAFTQLMKYDSVQAFPMRLYKLISDEIVFTHFEPTNSTV